MAEKLAKYRIPAFVAGGVGLIALICGCATHEPQPAQPTTPATKSSAAPPASAPAAATDVPETKEQRDARMKWWREARFGMFIHWGVYSVPAGVYQGRNIPSIGEWIMNTAMIPVAEYRKYVDQFNPTKFNADNFVTIAKNAGMKYIVITAKHHDGFAMFKSSDPFNIVDATPFKRDVIRELSVAARRQGIHFGVYYSQVQDWNHPGGNAAGRRNGLRDGQHWDPAAQDGSFDEYLAKVAAPQVKELLTTYHPEIFWWDTPMNITAAQAKPLHDLLALQPGIISNNRLGGGFRGDTESPEQTIPATGYPNGRDWETVMTINDTWGYKSTDTNFKSTQTLLRNLIDIASKGGNYMLNVGPTAEGLIPQPEIDRLAEMGRWLKINGEAIYASGPNPFPRNAATARVWDWRATSKLNADGTGKIYLHIFQWPADGRFTLTSTYMTHVTKAYLLADPKTVVGVGEIANGNERNYTLILPAMAPDPIASVVCLEVKPDGGP